MSKYGAKKTVVDGIKFDSKKEAGRYSELKLLERAGEIEQLDTQPEFVLQEAFEDRNGKRHRAIIYRADFSYREKGEPDVEVVEDVKGYLTKVYRIKKKLLLYKFRDIDFREI